MPTPVFRITALLTLLAQENEGSQGDTFMTDLLIESLCTEGSLEKAFFFVKPSAVTVPSEKSEMNGGGDETVAQPVSSDVTDPSVSATASSMARPAVAINGA